MKEIKKILESVFYKNNNNTIVISFADSDNEVDIIKTMENIKIMLNNIGVDIIAFHPDNAVLTLVTTADKIDEIEKLVADFNGKIIQSGF